ncbi:hypothetical protein [Rhodovulum visakhapatnamense]|uniref:BMFP domain-containing protein YqiC n=1 Tax=Rhodovulum visakhapatnamense TaxID=364297 RepID=A0ABS1RG20_9RHOB|nr:hypothetical protein [Rhodovulum visakhapatnamense]MBL3570663.1 hypothetical protein [Rhodovulum visakhapatnamense]MBL3577696.1 hypothetical protein [Rhodovulum visakhapatnamense]
MTDPVAEVIQEAHRIGGVQGMVLAAFTALGTVAAAYLRWGPRPSRDHAESAIAASLARIERTGEETSKKVDKLREELADTRERVARLEGRAER